MRFIADGPDIPDELLVARDAGRVVLFCGAGVSRAEAKLPNFAELARKTIESLGAAQDSRARVLLEQALALEPVPGVGGLVATDRVFGLLEQEFEISDVHAAVAEAIRPEPDVKLDAHRTLLDLATARGVTRIVTTNFDLLFEACDPNLHSFGPPRLPDPHSDRDFRGVVHLHGRVDAAYQNAKNDDEFVISSADFGRAYLSVGWATRFIQQLLSRFQVLFVGYTADDPPMQYLLEGLNLRAGTQNRLYAFQSGEQGSAIALWEHRGVKAIPFDNSNGFSPLWDTLRPWAERAKDVRAWFDTALTRAMPGPKHLAPYERGQVAHILSIAEGTRRLVSVPEPIGAEWLLVADPAQRYMTPGRAASRDEGRPPFDPFEALGLDSDQPPAPADPEDAFRDREIPKEATDILQPNSLDREHREYRFGAALRGPLGQFHLELPPRLVNIGIWIRRIAHQPVALWWAAHQAGLHPSIINGIENALLREPQRFSDSIRRGWRMLISARADHRTDPSMQKYDIEQRARQDGWNLSLVRDLAALSRPKVTVNPIRIPHPLARTEEGPPDQVVSVDVDYPHPHEGVQLPDDLIPYAVDCFRTNLDLAVALERDVSGTDWVYLQTSRGPDGGPELSDDGHGLTGPIIHFQKLMTQLASIDPEAARHQIRSWPSRDEYVFARLRIWAAGAGLLRPEEAGAIFLALSGLVFWGSVHKRDLLYALRDRWGDLSPNDRDALQQRLLTGSFPWGAEVPGGREEVNAHDRLSRLHWLSTQGVAFSFDVSETIRTLRAAAPSWTERAGDTIANSDAPEVFSVLTDSRPDPILETPIPEVLQRAQELGTFDISERTERAPFQGLAVQRPTRALGALTHAARSGNAPPWAWAAFLRAATRPADPLRMVRTIAARLQRLPLARLREIAYPVSDWMKAVGDRLYGDATNVLPRLWNGMMAALRSAEVEQRRRSPRSWAGEALNAPVGKLFEMLMEDPAKNGLSAGVGFPAQWKARVEDLLGLPGDLRRHALVMLGFQLNWLFYIDPTWTELRLLPLVDDSGPDSDALWDGIFWAARVPQRPLFLALKAALLARAIASDHRNEKTIVAGFLLAGWGDEAATTGRLVTDIELREVLIHADDEFRQQLLWQLGRLGAESDSPWRGRVIPFFQQVWPKQRAMHTPAMSGHLANFALDSGDLMPTVVQLILPRLGPVRNAYLRLISYSEVSGDHPARAYPAATLDLLWAVLGEDTSSWPYRVEQALDLLAQAPETASDVRLAELRRRIDFS